MATIENKAAGPHCLDFGPSWIEKLEVRCAGVVLESIENYGRLYALLMAAQTDDVHTTQGVYMNQQTCFKTTAASAGSAPGRVNAGPSYPVPSVWGWANDSGGNQPAYTPNAEENLPDGGVLFGTSAKYNGVNAQAAPVADSERRYTMCIPLVSALFNSSQMLPLLLTSAGITLSIELAPPTGRWGNLFH
jgi:hypothetical protein